MESLDVSTCLLRPYPLLLQQIKEHFRRLPSVRCGELAFHIFFAQVLDAVVVGLARLGLPRQRVVAVADGTFFQAVKMVAGPAEIRIVAPVISVLARDVGVLEIHPEQRGIRVRPCGTT